MEARRGERKAMIKNDSAMLKEARADRWKEVPKSVTCSGMMAA